MKNYQRIKSCASEPEGEQMASVFKEGLTYKKPDSGHCWDKNQKRSKEDKGKDGEKHLVGRGKKQIEETKKWEVLFFFKGSF